MQHIKEVCQKKNGEEIDDLKQYVREPYRTKCRNVDEVVDRTSFAKTMRHLVENWKGPSENRAVEQGNLATFFSYLFSSDAISRDWAAEIFPYLLDRGNFTRDVVFEQIIVQLQSLGSRAIPMRVMSMILKHCKPTIQEWFRIILGIPSSKIYRLFKNKAFRVEFQLYFIAIMATDKFSWTEKMLLVDKSDTNELFLTEVKKAGDRKIENSLDDDDSVENICYKLVHPDNLDIISKLEFLQQNNSILFNGLHQMHVLYLPELISLMQARKELFSVVDEDKVRKELEVIRGLITKCMTVSEIKPPTNKSAGLEAIFSQVVTEKKIDKLVEYVDYYLESKKLYECDSLLPFIVALLPYKSEIEENDKILQLIVRIIEHRYSEASTYVLYFITLFAKPFFKISRSVVIQVLTKLAVKMTVVPQIVNFFITMASMKLPEVPLIYASLVKLVGKYPMIYPEVMGLLSKMDLEAEFSELVSSQIDLLSTCCVATDSNDGALSLMSKLMKSNNKKLAYVIGSIQVLCENDVLDLPTVRKQLASKIKICTSVEVLIAYCRLLAVGVTPDEEETEEANHDFRVECIKELHKYTESTMDGVAAEAWIALGKYDFTEITESIYLNVPTLVLKYLAQNMDTKKGFVDFLKSGIHKEAESYPRPLYNLTSSTSEVPEIFSKIDTWKNELMTKHQNSEEFWKATLPMANYMIQLSSASNRAVNTVRLIRSCAMNVPISTSHEDLVHLVASWRRLTREALQCLAESKNNDVLWARDHICEEGKRALIEKSESVDNIMMMVTVLADCIMDMVKTLDDSKQVEDVINAQKVWLVSVFEFVATRLPKNMKSKREQKANPMYQIMTQSSKSSLHIAICCARLLMKHSFLQEFYPIPIEFPKISPVHESNTEVDRCDFWTSSEAFGASELSTEKTEKRIFKDDNYQVLEMVDLVEFIKSMKYMPRKVMMTEQAKLKKQLEKTWNNGTEDTKWAIYNALSQLAVVMPKQKTEKVLNFEKLSEMSVLRNVYQLFDEKYKLDKKSMGLLLQCLPNHERSDGRYLPAVDWKKIIEKVDWLSGDEHTKTAVISLACEQRIATVLYDSITLEERNDEQLSIFAKHLAEIVKVLPDEAVTTVTTRIFEMIVRLDGGLNTKQVMDSVRKCQNHPMVRDVIKNHLPDFAHCSDATTPFLSHIQNPEDYVNSISIAYDFWHESNRQKSMRMKRICELYAMEKEKVARSRLLCSLVNTAGLLNEKEKMDKIMDVITECRLNQVSPNPKDIDIYLPIIFAFIVAPDKHNNILTFHFGVEDETLDVMHELRLIFTSQFMKSSEVAKNYKILLTFFMPYIQKETSKLYEEWQTDVSITIVRSLIANFPSETTKYLNNESDEFWKLIAGDNTYTQ